MIPVSNLCHKRVLKNRIEYVSLKYSECRSNQLTSMIIPLGRNLRFYVINFRKLIIDTDTKSLLLLRMADMHSNENDIDLFPYY